MEVKAKAKYLRISPRKLRLQADVVRGKKVEEAEAILSALQTKGARMLKKVLQSAIANAEHNFKLKKEDLIIKLLQIDGGPVLKRYTPKAFGRAGGIRKPTSHITLVLSDGKNQTDEKASSLAADNKESTSDKDKKDKPETAKEKPADKPDEKADKKDDSQKDSKTIDKKS